MATITWGGRNGIWSFPTSWRQLKAPDTTDTAQFLATDTSTVTIDAPVAVRGVTLAAGSGATLLLQNMLTLTGALTLAGGTLSLRPGGTITGGTVDLAGGQVNGDGGIIDGSVLLGTLGHDVTVTAATIAATETARSNAPLAVVGTLNLAGGVYDDTVLALHPFGTSAGSELDVAAGAIVVLDTHARLSLSQDDPSHATNSNPAGPAPVLGGLGTLESAGTIVSNAKAATISAAGFVNAGEMLLVNAVVLGERQTFLGGTELTWTATFAPTLTVTSAQFENDGTITGFGATLDALGGSFVNTGVIDLGSGTTQAPITTSQTQTTGATTKPLVTTPQTSIGTIALNSTLDVAATVTSFSNTGVLAATQIDLEGNLALANLGTLQGTVVFTGTLDLGGGTLNAATLSTGTSYIFTGTVKNGTILDTNGSIDTAGATLVNTALLFTQPTTLTDVAGPGTVVLGATTTDIAYASATSVDGLTVVAGAMGITNGIILRNGHLTFGSKTHISDILPGSSIGITGGDFISNGAITLTGSTLEIATLDGRGTITLSANAVLTIDSLASSAAVTVRFAGGTSALILPGNATGVGQLGIKLTGLGDGDLIDFTGVSSDPGTVFAQAGAGISNGELRVQGASGDQAVLPTSATGLSFSAATDSNGGTIISVACFRHGTSIATPAGDRPVETLAVGDEVVTHFGETRRIKWLGRRAYARALVAKQRQLRPVRLDAGALENGLPRRPLYLSPLHGLLIDGLLVPVGVLVNGHSITRADVADVAYVHLELDTPDILLAEGAPSESFVDCNNRNMFHNCDEFAELYPGACPAWRFPMPRVEEGWELEAIRARLAVRAGVVPPTVRGKLRGHFDSLCEGRIDGWVMDEAVPSLPVTAELVAGTVSFGYVIANRYRIDLDMAEIGWAAHGFSADLRPIDPAHRAGVALVRLSDGARLTPDP